MGDTSYSRDRDGGVLYLHLNSEDARRIAKTIAVGNAVNIDVTPDGDVYGIECLDATSPFAQFIRAAVGDIDDEDFEDTPDIDESEDAEETNKLIDRRTKHVEFLSGYRNSLIAQGWDEDAAEELIISMVAQGRA